MTNTTLSATYSFLRLSNANRKLILTLATLENGAKIAKLLPTYKSLLKPLPKTPMFQPVSVSTK